MAITLEQAKNLHYGQHVWVNDRFNANGTPMKAKINGGPKTWKRQPERVQIPFKHGLYDYGYLDETDLGRICLTEAEAKGQTTDGGAG